MQVHPSVKRDFLANQFEFFYDVDQNLGGPEWDMVAEWCVRNVTPNDYFLEIGAHIGYMSVIVQRICKPKFSVFVEPDMKTVKILKANLLRNCEGTYEIVPKAVLDKKGYCDFYYNIENPALNSVYEGSENREKVFIQTTTVDDLVEEFKLESPIVMKIDAEFSEPLIWQGMKKTIPKVKAICMEFYPPELEKHTDPEEFLNLVKENFRVEDLNGTNICLYRA